MSKKLIAILPILFFITAINIFSQMSDKEIQETFEQALDFMEEGNYKDAVELLELLNQEIDAFDLYYCLGKSYYHLEDCDMALKYLEICDDLDDQHFYTVNYLIRVKYRQGNLDDVESLKQRLRQIRQNHDSNEIRRLQRFTIDRFDYNDLQIIVEESFELSGFLYYHWIFNIYDSDDNFIRSVNLETSVGLREMSELKYIIGVDVFKGKNRIHSTTNVGFKELPEYNEMKAVVIEEIKNGLGVSAQGVYPIR